MEVEELDDDGDDRVDDDNGVDGDEADPDLCMCTQLVTFRLAKRHRAVWGGEVADEGVPSSLLHVAELLSVWSVASCGSMVQVACCRFVELWSMWSVASCGVMVHAIC